MAGPITVLIADDHAVVRRGVRVLLESYPDFTVVGEAEDGPSAVAMARQLLPSVILMDARMPQGSGVAAARELAVLRPRVAVVIFTGQGQEQLLRDAVAAGASGFLLKDCDPEELAEGLRRAARGEAYLDKRMAGALVRALAEIAEPKTLTSREREIITLMADGLHNQGIADALVVSIETVKTHVRSILGKLEADDRTHAVAIALRRQIIA